MEVFDSRSIVLVTGASQGIGRAIACSLARQLSAATSEQAKKSTFLLVARSKDGLEETLKLMKSQISSEIEVRIVVGDLGDIQNLPKLVDNIFDKVTPSDFASSFLINNAGSMGDPAKTIIKFTDVDEIDQHMRLNITSAFYLTSRFLNAFSTSKRYVVNISSLLAITQGPSVPLYRTSKAARDMLFHTLAAEQDDVRVLNYSPGPVNTAMFDDILHNCCNSELRESFQKTKDEGFLLEPETTAEKLTTLLKQDRYVSGKHIDYFDELP